MLIFFVFTSLTNAPRVYLYLPQEYVDTLYKAKKAPF